MTAEGGGNPNPNPNPVPAFHNNAETVPFLPTSYILDATKPAAKRESVSNGHRYPNSAKSLRPRILAVGLLFDSS